MKRRREQHISPLFWLDVQDEVDKMGDFGLYVFLKLTDWSVI